MNKPVVVISGATGGTGKVVARAFAEREASLILLGSDQAKLDGIVKDLGLPSSRILAPAADLRDAAKVQAMGKQVIDKFGRVDVLVHLVGGWTGGKTLIETPGEDLTWMVDQHLWTTFHLLQVFAPSMMKNKWGRVIAVSSPSAVQPPARSSAYAVGKAAEETLLLTLAQEAGESGVTANILQVRSIDVDHKGKGTTPEQILAAILYLCSEEAGKINGARIPLY